MEYYRKSQTAEIIIMMLLSASEILSPVRREINATTFVNLELGSFDSNEADWTRHGHRLGYVSLQMIQCLAGAVLRPIFSTTKYLNRCTKNQN